MALQKKKDWDNFSPISGQIAGDYHRIRDLTALNFDNLENEAHVYNYASANDRAEEASPYGSYEHKLDAEFWNEEIDGKARKDIVRDWIYDDIKAKAQIEAAKDPDKEEVNQDLAFFADATDA